MCAYPKIAPVRFTENTLWDGYAEETNTPYRLAKKMLLVQRQVYHSQYGFNAVHLIPINLYGPRDNYSPETSHVIPALICKCVEAQVQGDAFIDVWGTESTTREFLHVEDAAEGIVLATERYDKPDPINLGIGKEIRWNTSQPDDQPCRSVDESRAGIEFGFKAQVDFREGMRRTIETYRQHLAVANGITSSITE